MLSRVPATVVMEPAAEVGIKIDMGIGIVAEAIVGIVIVGVLGTGHDRGLEVGVVIGTIVDEDAGMGVLTGMEEGGVVVIETGAGTIEVAGEERGRLLFLNMIGSLEVPRGPHLISM